MTGATSFNETLMKMAKKPQKSAVVAAYKMP
jgi:phage terminase large subunit-like protein